MEGVVNFSLIFAYILVIVAGLGAIVLPLINAMSNPSGLKKALIGVAGIAVVFLIAWAMAGDEVTAKYIAHEVSTGATSKMVGGAITMMYLLIGFAVVGIIYTEVSKMIK